MMLVTTYAAASSHDSAGGTRDRARRLHAAMVRNETQDQNRAGAGVWLSSLNFFAADVQAGVGPFLGVFLQARGWHPGAIGTVMTAGGIAGMLATPFAGAIVDHTRAKRAALAAASLFSGLAALALLISHAPAWVGASQVLTALCGALIGPGVAGLTLGIAGQRGFPRRNGLNQMFNHAGNVAGALLAGGLGWRFGWPAVFGTAAAFAALAIISVLMIPERAIDHQAARGMDEGGEGAASGRAPGLLRDRRLLALAGALAMFHLGNAAMLPLFGQAVVAARRADPAIFTAETIAVAQTVMVGTAWAATRLSGSRGYWLVLLISFAALPVRGLVAASAIAPWGVWPVQALDGVGAGLQSVAVPGLVARLLRGSGRVNAGQGFVLAAQGLGAALSPALGGWIAETLGYRTAFTALGAIAIGSVALWLAFRGAIDEGERG